MENEKKMNRKKIFSKKTDDDDNQKKKKNEQKPEKNTTLHMLLPQPNYSSLLFELYLNVNVFFHGLQLRKKID